MPIALATRSYTGAATSISGTALVALTDSTGGTAGATVVDVPGTYTEATLANQLASITAAVNGAIARINGTA